MRLRFAFLSMVLTAGAAADVPPAQRAEVEHLVAFLEESDCVMIRNGERHDGVDAAEHVRRKYEHFRDRIDSTEAFIARAATKRP